MGLYRIPIKQEMVEKIPDLIRASGIAIVRITNDGAATYYWYTYPIRPNKEYAFWITSPSDGKVPYLMIGMGRRANEMLKLLRAAGVFCEST